MKILVTGADGFIGSHLTEKLIKEGYSVKALVQYNSFNSYGWLDGLNLNLKKNVEIVSGDIRDINCVRSAVKSCEVVLHLAALISIPYSYNSPFSYVDTNVLGTLNILQTCLDLGIKKLIHTSTSEVYGTAKFVPISEDHQLNGQSPYSASKIAADQLAFSFYSSFNLPVVILRPFNTYGPRQSARAVIPTIISQMINSNELKLGSLNPTRDFTYVDDTVQGFLCAMNSTNGIGQTVNLGTNFEISIGNLTKLIAEIMDKNINIHSEDQRVRPKKSEVERLKADNNKALNLFGWKPKFKDYEGLNMDLKKQ